MVENNSRPQEQEEALVSNGAEPKSYLQVDASYLGNDDKVEGFSHSESEDEEEVECREDLPEELSIDCESSNSREVLGASISNSFDSIVNAPSEEMYLNDSTHDGRQGPSSLSEEMYLNDGAIKDHQGPSSLSLSVSAENHQEAKETRSASGTVVESVLTEESVKRVSTEETNESDGSTRSRESAKSASILDDESIEDEDYFTEASEQTDEPSVVKRKSRIQELKEQLGLVERKISASSSEGSDAMYSISTTNDSIEIMSPAPTMDSAYDGEVEIEDSATEDSLQLAQESSTSSSGGLQSILVKTSSDEKKKKNSEKRVQFDLESVQPVPQHKEEEEPKSFWDVLDNMLVHTDLGLLDRSSKHKDSSTSTKQKSLMDGMAKEVKLVDASSGDSPGDQLPVVDFKAIDKLIAANHRNPNRLPSIPECTEPSFEASTCDDQSLTEEQKRMGLTSLADMSVVSNVSESIAENKATESEMNADTSEATEEKKSFFSGWNCGNLKCLTPETKDMCGPTMKLPGMIALQAMNTIPINENLIHLTDSEQQNQSISRSIQMANEHVNGTKAYLSMIDGVDSEDDDESTVVSEGTARASNVMNDENSSVASCQSECSTDTDQHRKREEPPGWQTVATSLNPEHRAVPASTFRDAPSSPKEVPIVHDEDHRADPASIFREAPSSPKEARNERRTDSSSSAVRKPMDPPTSPQHAQQATATMEISEARKSLKHAEQKTRARKPDPESFEASKPKASPEAETKSEKAKKKTVAKSRKMDPTESKPKASKLIPAKNSESKPAVDLTTQTTTTKTKLDPFNSISTKKKTQRTMPTPEIAMMTTVDISTVEPTLGSNHECPIDLVKEEQVEEMRDETPDKTASSSSSVPTSVAATPENDEKSSPATTNARSQRLTSKLKKKQAERQQLKEKLLSQMPPLYALKPDEIALILEVSTREYLSDRKSYNLAYEQARWCVLAAQSNADQSLTMDMIHQIVREECQRFRE